MYIYIYIYTCIGSHLGGCISLQALQDAKTDRLDAFGSLHRVRYPDSLPKTIVLAT